MKTTSLTLFACLSSAVLAAGTSYDMGPVLAKAPNLTFLSQLFQADPALFDAAQDPVQITFLAPSDVAFGEFLKANRGAGNYLADKALRFKVFKQLMNFHTIKGSFTSDRLFSNEAFYYKTYLKNPSLEDGWQVLRAVKNGNASCITGGQNITVKTLTTDLELWNGYVHVVDRFLGFPLSVSKTASALYLNDFHNAVKKSNMDQELDNNAMATVFIPSDDMNDVLAQPSINSSNVIDYHVIPGRVMFSTGFPQEGKTSFFDTKAGKKLYISQREGSIYVNDAKVYTTDVMTANGVVHIIDRFLDPTESKSGKCKCLGRFCYDSKGSVCKSKETQAGENRSPISVSGSDKEPQKATARKLAVHGGALAVLTAILFLILS